MSDAMGNFFTDNDDLVFLFDFLDLAEVATAQEDNFKQQDGSGDGYAPIDAADAIDNYRRILTIVGDVAANRIAPRAEKVDHEGNTLNDDGTVTLGEGVRENINSLAQADLMGFTLPREYGGLNCPNLIYTMAVEMVSRADASLMNIFGLQGIAETINAFADDGIKGEYLPRFSRGEVTGAMVLTEPDAGSDLQAVSLRAWQDDDGQWRLNGVKRFITNGCGEVLLTLARSEPDIRDGRGLSLFLVDRGPRIKVRHLEEKLGIHGSPTCELVYDDAPAKLIGERQLGLIRYVMSLMNGARVGIAGQSLGIAEAAYRVARNYAAKRKQFGVAIEQLPAVAEMVVDMKVAIEAGRALTYETCRICDLENNNLRVLETAPPTDKDEAKERKQLARSLKRLNGMLTPMSKYYCSEMCVRVANDAVQVLGGSGYMSDYPVERYLRDARITTIYEGTSQLQVVAAVRGVCSDAFTKYVEAFEADQYTDDALAKLHTQLVECKQQLAEAVDAVRAEGGNYMDLSGRRLVDAAAVVIIGHLLLRQAKVNERKRAVAERFITTGALAVQRDVARVKSGDKSVMTNYALLAGPVCAGA
ncbi:MAG: acyl-CoA dehydrogenase family protein [Phycisphaerales bacterium]|nr:acyl-CoA dehydrogenase family protein [Phycisphaerales bacterium]